MSTLETNLIQPATGTTLTVGASGDTITVPAGATINLSAATQTGVGGDNTPFFLADGSGSLSLTNDTNTLVSILAETYDTGSTFASNRFTPAVAGYYYLEGQVSINNSTAGTQLISKIYKNGSQISYANAVAEGTNNTYTAITSVIDLANTTDYYELYVYQNTGGGANMNAGYTWFKGFKLIT
jgi:hypothetical protein